MNPAGPLADEQRERINVRVLEFNQFAVIQNLAGNLVFGFELG